MLPDLNIQRYQIIQQQKAMAAVTVPTFPADALNRFIAYCDVTPATLKTYSRNLTRFFEWMSENGVTHPTREDVLHYRDDLKSRLKPATVQAYMAVVRIFFDWLDTEGYYPNVAKRIKGAKVSREHKRDALTSDQVRGILSDIDRSTVKGARDFAIFGLMTSCGLRSIEVCRLTVSDLTVSHGRSVILVQGKGRDEKTAVNIPIEAERAIRAYWKAAGISKREKGLPMFRSTSAHNRGQAITTRSVRQIVKDILRASGYDDDRLSAHSLRHTAVTNAIEQGQPLEVAQAFARHCDINTTMIYNHALIGQKNPCADINGRSFMGGLI